MKYIQSGLSAIRNLLHGFLLLRINLCLMLSLSQVKLFKRIAEINVEEAFLNEQ